MREGDSSTASQRDRIFNDIVNRLRDPQRIESTLQVLQASPSGDRRIIPYLKELLTDTTLCIVSVPYRYGEIRWLAAYALRSESRASGLAETITLADVVRPLDFNEVATLARNAGVWTDPPFPGALDTVERLRKLGKVPLDDIVLSS